MHLGADAISIELAGEAHELRPTLRAGMRLVRRHSFSGLIAAAQDFNTSTIGDVLHECGVRRALLTAEIDADGVAAVRARLIGPLAEFALAVAGIDPDAGPAPAQASSTMTPRDYHTRLFEVATGWLGWTPEQAWNATPAEIIHARAGRMGMIEDVLGALFGTPTDATAATTYTPEQIAEIITTGNDPAFDRTGLHALKQQAKQ